MTPRARLVMLLGSAAVVAALFGGAVLELPAFGRGDSAYARLLIAAAVPDRHVTNVVTATNFDFRGIDTLGEEFILFASIVGVTVLLRAQPGDEEATETYRRGASAATAACRAVALALVGPVFLFAASVVAHGALTPGGGFQGGVIAATAVVLLGLTAGLTPYERVARESLLHLLEAAALLGFAAVGASGALAGHAFLANVWPLGHTGSVVAGGTIPAANLATGIAVAAGFLVLLLTFLREGAARRERRPE